MNDLIFFSLKKAPNSGELKLTMTATDTTRLKEGRYRYDVLITESGGDKVHVIEGSAMVRAGVTT